MKEIKIEEEINSVISEMKKIEKFNNEPLFAKVSGYRLDNEGVLNVDIEISFIYKNTMLICQEIKRVPVFVDEVREMNKFSEKVKEIHQEIMKLTSLKNEDEFKKKYDELETKKKEYMNKYSLIKGNINHYESDFIKGDVHKIFKEYVSELRDKGLVVFTIKGD